jgi:hypothetical protein
MPHASRSIDASRRHESHSSVHSNAISRALLLKAGLLGQD